MAHERHRQVQALLEQAAALPTDRRTLYLREACGGDAPLLDECRAMLPHYLDMQCFEPKTGALVADMPGSTTFAHTRAEARLAAERAELRVPDRIDAFRVLGVLGRGGMGVVYRAEHGRSRTPCAIKVLRSELESGDDRWRFSCEAQILRQLQHPGIARIKQWGEVPLSGRVRPYFVMDLVEGVTLSGLVGVAATSARERLLLMALICEAVAYAHHRGIVHCDLKPGNILVDAEGRPKILDFGVARIGGFQGIGQTGFAGTPEYASPEQFGGRWEAVTPRCDVYALGIILHELLTGARPARTRGRVHLCLERVVLEDGRGGVSRQQRAFRLELGRLLARALQDVPVRRFAHAGELGEKLDALLERFLPRSGWELWRRRVGSGQTPQRVWQAAPTTAMLRAVLRKRIALGLESSGRG